MREIKFRGKNVNGYLVFGNLHIHENTHDSSKNLYYIIRPCFVPALTMPADNYIEVDPATVGQYVRKQDKNGTDIFEGDILQRYKKNGEPYKGTKIVPSIEDVNTSNIVFNESVVISNIHEPQT